MEKRYKKFPNTRRAVKPLMLSKWIFWTALKSTTEVASFTTPSPNTKLYSNGVSSWWRIYNISMVCNWFIIKTSLRRRNLRTIKSLKKKSRTCRVQTVSVEEKIVPMAESRKEKHSLSTREVITFSNNRWKDNKMSHQDSLEQLIPWIPTWETATKCLVQIMIKILNHGRHKSYTRFNEI